MIHKKVSLLAKSLLAGVILFIVGWPLLLTGGSLDPTAPPGSTMNSLEDIYNAVSNVQLTIDNLPAQGTSDIAGKEGFTQQFTFTNYDNVAKNFSVMIVPTGKNLVVVHLYIKGYQASLDVWQSGVYQKTLIDSDFLGYSETSPTKIVFPEPCMMLKANETLYVKLQPKSIPENPYWKSTIKFALVGYYIAQSQ